MIRTTTLDTQFDMFNLKSAQKALVVFMAFYVMFFRDYISVSVKGYYCEKCY